MPPKNGGTRQEAGGRTKRKNGKKWPPIEVALFLNIFFFFFFVLLPLWAVGGWAYPAYPEPGGAILCCLYTFFFFSVVVAVAVAASEAAACDELMLFIRLQT